MRKTKISPPASQRQTVKHIERRAAAKKQAEHDRNKAQVERWQQVKSDLWDSAVDAVERKAAELRKRK